MNIRLIVAEIIIIVFVFSFFARWTAIGIFIRSNSLCCRTI